MNSIKVKTFLSDEGHEATVAKGGAMNRQYIDLTTETPIPINQAPKHYPAGRPSISTVYRHFTRGCRGAKLETFVEGGRRYTTIEAIGRFIERTTANSAGASLPLSQATSRQREAEICKAEREATEAGI